jgi:hypothetical protein
VEFVDLTKLEPNTTTIDTLLLKIDSEFHAKITFIITQEFGSSLSSPLRQRINIITSEEIQLQLNQAFKSGASVVKTSIIGDRISTDQNWAKKDNYFFTQVTGNFRIAPRPIESYIPLLYNSKHLGWLRIKMDVDSNWVIKRFFVEEFCIQQELPTTK